MRHEGEGESSTSRLQWLPAGIRDILSDRPVLTKIVANVSWLTLERVLSMATSFVVTVWVIRYLGAERYGIYAYALSLVAMFRGVSALGLEKIVIRNLAGEASEDAEVLATAFWLRMVGAVVTYGLVAVLVLTLEDDVLTRTAVLVVAGRFVFDAAEVFDYWFQAQVQSRYAVYVRSASRLLAAGLQVVCILLGLSVLAFLTVVVVQAAFSAGGLIAMVYFVGLGRLRWRPDPELARRLLRQSWPLMVAGISTLVYMKIDQVMLKQMVGDAAVGTYAAAIKVSELWYFLPGALAASSFPEIVRSRRGEEPAVYRSRVQSLYDGMVWFAYAVCIPLTFLAGPITDLLFGAEYAGAAAILQVHVWALVFMALGLARSKWLIAENMTRFVMLSSAFGAVANVAFNLLLIPAHSGLGAAWATLLSYGLYAYVTPVAYGPARLAFRQMSKALAVPFRFVANRFVSSSGSDPRS